MEIKPFKQFEDKEGIIRVWQTCDGEPYTLEIRPKNKPGAYFTLIRNK